MPRPLSLVSVLAVCGLALGLGSAGLPTTYAQNGQPPAASVALTGTAFTYQGQLKNGSAPVTGNCGMQFAIYDAATVGNRLGGIISTTVPVNNGLFTVALDFYTEIFTGPARWLDIQVKCGSDVGFTPLTPRQALTAVPYALALPGLYTTGGASSLPNLIGGYAGNGVGSEVYASTIGGGGDSLHPNAVETGGYSVIDGGAGNNIKGEYASIGGGKGNQLGSYQAWVNYSSIGGGLSNTISSSFAFIGGGADNLADATFATIGGGYNNYVSGPGANVIGGGANNNASGDYVTVGGGFSNTATNSYSTIGGGYTNQASGYAATISGGETNTALGIWSTVGGGVSNHATGNRATVSGGYNNLAYGPGSVVGGGGFNGTFTRGSIAYGEASTVAGGQGNLTGFNAMYSTIGGGYSNTVIYEAATVSGGEYNVAVNFAATIAGGQNNLANGAYATIPGGQSNVASGDFSYAAGWQAKALHHGAFVWADSVSAPLSSTVANQFLLRASGGVTLYTDAGATTGVSLAPGSGSWTSVSNRYLKANLAPVNNQDILAKVAALPLHTWNYTAQDESIRHIGPMAQDFYAAFNVGETDTGISVVDADGVALAAIQGLNDVVAEKEARITALETHNANLEARLTALENAAAPSPTGQPFLFLIIGLGFGAGAFWLGQRQARQN